MVLRLHVWGPAFGLASIDAECLATITYLAYAVPRSGWEIVATSPSGVPTRKSTAPPPTPPPRPRVTGGLSLPSSETTTLLHRVQASLAAVCRVSPAREAHKPPPPFKPELKQMSDRTTDSLPALHDTGTGTWTTSFTPIVAHLGNLNPAWDLDARLDPSQRADSTAYAAFLSGTAAPLLALSLYVSSANWAGTTRPAYSTVLPFPLTWTEPLTIRKRMCHVADHLGLSDLNIDDTPEENAARSAADQDTRGFLKIPDRLRPRKAGVKAFLSPEQTNLFRLEATARECLGVLADLKGQQEQHDDGGGSAGGRRFFLGNGDDGSRPTALDCLAFGYLALMLVPEVPRPWLRDTMRRRYDCLCVFVDGVRDELFGGDVASLPWRPAGDDEVEPWRVTRFASGGLKAVVPGEWLTGGESPSHASKTGAVLAALGSSVTALGLVGGVLLYRHLSPFGSVLYRWETRRQNFGAAGAFFGI